MTPARAAARSEGLVFLLLLSAYAWFHPGGGWQQNARYDQIRSLVETGRFDVNAYIAYDPSFVRTPLPPVVDPSASLPALHTWDLSYYEGRFFPNKPPGVTLLAAPGYALLRRIAGAFGVSADGPRSVEILGWLTSVLSVALLGAAAGVLFLRLARRLFPSVGPRPAIAATLALGLGTPFLPYATMLFDHVPVAALLLLAFERLVAARDSGATAGRLAAAGAAAGMAVVSNYAALLAAAVLAGYAALAIRPMRCVTWGVIAAAPFAAFLLAYHAAAFGGPFTIANTWQPDLFQDGSGTRFLSVFAPPDPRVALDLLVSPYRGLLVASPVLVLAFAFAPRALRGGRALEIATGLSLFAAYFLMNASFNAWHGGFAYGPRYLVPALPFVALALVPAFASWPRVTGAAAAVSIALCVVATAVDPMPPQDIERPWGSFLLPLAAGGRIERPEGRYEGPVSANRVGMGAPGREDEWNAFNAGEIAFPGSWWSLAPLLALQGAGWGLLLTRAREGRPAS